MNFDAVLEATGGFGTYQIVSLLWFQSVLWLIVPNVSFMVFGGIPEKFRCEWNETRSALANGSSALAGAVEVIDPNEFLLSNQTYSDYSCTVVQGRFQSVLMDWSLRGRFGLKLAAWMTTAQMLGVFFGPLISGQLSDQFGRRKVFLLFFLSLLVSSFSSAFATGWKLFVVMRFLIGLSIGAAQSVHFVIIQELLLPKWRLVIYVGGWPFGFIYAGLLAYFTNHWKWYTVASALSGLPALLLTLFWIQESPKWLLEKNRTKEALLIIQKIAARNGVGTSTLTKLLRRVSVERQQSEGEDFHLSPATPTKAKVFTYLHLFRNKAEAVKSLALAFSWFTAGLVYYSLLFNVGSLMGQPAINIIILGAIRLVVNGLLVLVDQHVAKVGRRMFHQTGLLIVSAAMLAMAAFVLREQPSGVSRILYLLASLIGTTACSPVWSACDCFSAEIFPTALRTMGNAFCSSSARIGSSIAPQLLLLAIVWSPLPCLVLAAVALTNFIISYFLLPETKGKPLPDLYEEAVVHKPDFTSSANGECAIPLTSKPI